LQYTKANDLLIFDISQFFDIHKSPKINSDMGGRNDELTADNQETRNGANEQGIHSKTAETTRTPPNSQQTVSYF
jgi:hypothetical protein